jgi:hypothetical protein
VADPANATEWENILREATSAAVTVAAPPAPAELAARTAKRAANADAKINLLPAEFSARYQQQFVDRLWLTGLMYAFVVYGIFLAIYFSAAEVRKWQAKSVESKVAAISNDYTNSVQLQARLNVLKERAQLKYAALDSWKIVAQQTPPGITLQRMSFSEGQRISMGGTTTPDMINTLLDFDANIRKVKLNDQFVFDQQRGEHVNPRTSGNVTTWSMSVELLRTEKDAP